MKIERADWLGWTVVSGLGVLLLAAYVGVADLPRPRERLESAVAPRGTRDRRPHTLQSHVEISGRPLVRARWWQSFVEAERRRLWHSMRECATSGVADDEVRAVLERYRGSLQTLAGVERSDAVLPMPHLTGGGGRERGMGPDRIVGVVDHVRCAEKLGLIGPVEPDWTQRFGLAVFRSARTSGELAGALGVLRRARREGVPAGEVDTLCGAMDVRAWMVRARAATLLSLIEGYRRNTSRELLSPGLDEVDRILEPASRIHSPEEALRKWSADVRNAYESVTPARPWERLVTTAFERARRRAVNRARLETYQWAYVPPSAADAYAAICRPSTP